MTYGIHFTDAFEVTLSAESIIVQLGGSAAADTTKVEGTGLSSRKVTLSQITGEGSLGILIPFGAAMDEAGNPSVTALGEEVVVDRTPPIVSVSPPSIALTRSGPVQFAVMFEDASQITLGNADVLEGRRKP